jgi:Protein predicted to be involved in meiotic recombination
LSKSEKQERILTHLRTTATCHTLKDLEKSLPSVASIPGIQVKEYIQALLDEDKLRVEKIGSGNWYWCFASDEKHECERQVVRVKTEVEKARKSCTDAEAALAAESTRRQLEADCGDECEALAVKKAEIEAEVVALRAMQQSEGKSARQLQQELEEFRQQAMQWTDNIYILEEYMRRLAGGDRAIVAAVQRDCYGDEYVDGGLREL